MEISVSKSTFQESCRHLLSLNLNLLRFSVLLLEQKVQKFPEQKKEMYNKLSHALKYVDVCPELPKLTVLLLKEARSGYFALHSSEKLSSKILCNVQCYVCTVQFVCTVHLQCL